MSTSLEVPLFALPAKTPVLASTPPLKYDHDGARVPDSKPPFTTIFVGCGVDFDVALAIEVEEAVIVELCVDRLEIALEEVVDEDVTIVENDVAAEVEDSDGEEEGEEADEEAEDTEMVRVDEDVIAKVDVGDADREEETADELVGVEALNDDELLDELMTVELEDDNHVEEIKDDEDDVIDGLKLEEVDPIEDEALLIDSGLELELELTVVELAEEDVVEAEMIVGSVELMIVELAEVELEEKEDEDDEVVVAKLLAMVELSDNEVATDVELAEDGDLAADDDVLTATDEELDEEEEELAADGELEPVLVGVAEDKIAEAEVVNDELRTDRLAGAELEDIEVAEEEVVVAKVERGELDAVILTKDEDRTADDELELAMLELTADEDATVVAEDEVCTAEDDRALAIVEVVENEEDATLDLELRLVCDDNADEEDGVLDGVPDDVIAQLES
ncbi:hypothetical protein ACEQ8H_006986 [Pleosporales sp. CAS-2024a]